MASLKQRSIDAIIWTLLEKYGIQVFALFIGIILARLLTPADYGLIGMISVFFAIALVFVNSGFSAAYIQKKDANEVDASTIFFFNLITSIFFYGVLWFTAPLIADFYGQIQLIDLIRVSGVILIINSFSMIQIAKLTKQVKFRKKTIISLVGTILSGIVGIWAALTGYGVWSLVFQQITNTSVTAIGLWLFYKWRPQLVFNIGSLKTMFSFSSYILMSNIIRTIFDNIYILVIGKFFPAAQLGFYTKAKSYQKLVSKQPASAIGVVSFPVFSKLQDDKPALKNSMKKFSQHTLFFIAPISAVLFVIAKPLVLVVLTEKWMPMAPYFQLLLLVGFFYPLNLMNVQLLNAQGKSKLNFRITIIKNSLHIINIIVMYRFGVIYIIYGEIIVSMLALFINGHYSKALISYGTLEQLKDLWLTLFITIILVTIGYFITLGISNDYYKIIIGGTITLSGYTFLQYLLNKKMFISNLDIIRVKLFNK